MYTHPHPAAPIGAHSADTHTPPARRRTVRRPTPKAEKLPLPKLPEKGTPEYTTIFWLCAWAIGEAELAALAELRHTAYVSNRCSTNNALARAMAGAQCDVRQKNMEAAKQMVREGSLLFAWSGSTRIPA